MGITKTLSIPGKARESEGRPNKLTRYAFYAVVFAFPWESIEIGLGENFSLAKIFGLFFFGVALLQPKICFRFPPKAFWLFLLYFSLHALLAVVGDASYDRIIMIRGLTFVQMLVLFWLSFNVMHDDRTVKGFLLALIGACLSLSLVGSFMDGVVGGHTGGDRDSERLTVLGSTPGTTGATLALGLIALMGLVYGRKERNYLIRILVWGPFLIMAGFLVSTGSRAAMLAFAIGIGLFFNKGGNVRTKIRIGMIFLFGLGILIWLTFQFHPETLSRFENTVNEGDTAGRDIIYAQSAEMVNEKPLLGWGPVHYRYELARRVGYKGQERDPHNLILKILLEVGLVGAIPYFLGIGSCLWAAWTARNGFQGPLPLSMLVTVLMINMSQPWDNRKIYWIILAYALVSVRLAYPLKRTKSVSFSDRTRGVELTKSAKKPGVPVVASHSS